MWLEAKGLQGVAGFSGTFDTPHLDVLSWVPDSFCFSFFLVDRCRSSCGECLEEDVGVGSGGRGQVGDCEDGRIVVEEPLSAV